MALVRCLVDVPHVKLKRTYALSDGSLDSLKAAIAVCPVLGKVVELSTMRFQIFDGNFAEYIDLAPGDTIPDMAKVNLLPIDGPFARANEPSTSSARGLDLSAEQQGCAESSIAECSERQDSASLESFELPASSDDDGTSFVLPSLDALHNVITSGEPLTSAAHRKIVDILYNEMLKLTIVPTRQFYNKVSNLLLDRYPQLADVIGTGAESWKLALRNKFKNARRHISGDSRVEANRMKFGAGRKSAAAEKNAPQGTIQEKRMKLSSALPETVGEDETSINEHEEWLLAEAKKAMPNEQEIDARMTITAEKRLAAMRKSSVSGIKKKYPYIMDPRRFLKDFQRLTKIEASIVVRGQIDEVAGLAQRNAIKCREEDLRLLLEAASMDQARLRTRHILTVAVLKVLAHNVREPAAIKLIFIESEKDEDSPETPCIRYRGSSLEHADSFHLTVDKKRLFAVSNAEEGLAALMAAYFIFNIKYPSKAYNTLVATEWLLFGLQSTAPRMPVTKLLNKVKKLIK